MRIFLLFSGFSLGMVIFLSSLKLLGQSLESVLGQRLRLLLLDMTATKERSVLAGLVGTCLIQSSSAVASTMVVFVDAGVLSLSQAFGVILGANIGTTLTAQIISLRLEFVAWPLMLGGILLYFLLNRRRTLGIAVFALGSLFFGLTITTSALSPLLQLPFIQNSLINLTDTPLEAVLMGVILTSLVQSSSALTGLVISLTSLGQLPLNAAVGLALGSNIGTVVTTLIASLGRDRASKATAYADLFFNVGGVLLIMPFFPVFLHIITGTSSDPARQVANAHTLFNAVTALLALPFLDYLAQAAWWGAGIRWKNKNIKD